MLKVLALSLIVLLVSCSSIIKQQVTPTPLPVTTIIKQVPVSSVPIVIKQSQISPHKACPIIQEKITYKLINEILKMIIVFAAVVFSAGVIVEHKFGICQRVIDFVATIKAKL